MRRTTHVVAMILASTLAMLSGVAVGADEISIDYFDSDGDPTHSDPDVDAGAPITLDPSPTDAYVRIAADTPQSQDIGRVTFSSSSDTGTFNVQIHNDSTIVSTAFPSSAGCRHWDGIDASATSRTVEVRGRIIGDLTDEIENVADIVSLHVESAVDALVSSGECFRFWMGDTTSASGFSFSQTLRQFEVRDAGKLLGDVSTATFHPTAASSFLAVRHDNGTPGQIGNPNDLIDLQVTDGDLRQLVCSGDMYADVSIMDGSNEGLIVDGFCVGSGVSPEGSYSGRLEFLGFAAGASQIDIGADLETDGEIWIGGSYTKTGKDLEIEGELKGQIIINQNGGAGTWATDAGIEVGGVLLSPIPYYANKASDLGGGSVGEAPFYVHKESCTPGYSRSADDYPRVLVGDLINDNEVHLRFYGPVVWCGAQNCHDPVVVERRLACTTGTWSDVTSSFNFNLLSTDRRTLVVKDGFVNDYEYRITPVTSGDGQLLSDDVDGNPNVEDFEYIVQLICMGDTDGDGSRGLVDLIQLLTDWGTSECITDLNNSGTVDNSDLLLLLANWGDCSSPGGSLTQCEQDCLDNYSDPQDRIDCLEQCP